MGTPRDSIPAARLAELREVATMALDSDREMPQSLKEDEGIIENVMSSAWLHAELVAAGATADQATDIVKQRAKKFEEEEAAWTAAGKLLTRFRLAHTAEQAYEALVDTITDRRDFSQRLLCAVRVLPPREAAMLFAAVDVNRSAFAAMERAQIRPTRIAHTSHQMRIYEASEAAVATLLELAEQPPTEGT